MFSFVYTFYSIMQIDILRVCAVHIGIMCRAGRIASTGCVDRMGW